MEGHYDFRNFCAPHFIFMQEDEALKDLFIRLWEKAVSEIHLVFYARQCKKEAGTFENPWERVLPGWA